MDKAKKTQAMLSNRAYNLFLRPLHMKVSYKGILTLGAMLSLGLTSLPSLPLLADAQSWDENENNNAAHQDIKTLQDQLQNLNRELHNYKARLFRSSHPKDVEKIAELGQMIAEKETLNKKLSTSLENLENELNQAKRQTSTNERATEALTTLIQNQKDMAEAQAKAYEEKLQNLHTLLDNQKAEYMSRIHECEQSQERMVRQLEEKERLIGCLKNTIQEHHLQNECLVQEHQQATESLNQRHLQETNQLSCQAKTVFEELQSSELSACSTRDELMDQIQSLNRQIEKERLYFESLGDDLQMAKEEIQAKEKRLQELEQKHNDSLTFAADLANRLEESQTHHTNTQEDLTSTLNELETAKNSLLEELRLSKDELDKRSNELESLEQQFSEISARYEAQQQHSQSTELSLASLENELFNLQSLLSKYEDQIAEHEEASSHLSAMKQHIENLQEDKQTLSQALQSREEELHSTLDSHQQAMEQKQSHISATEQKFEAEIQRLQTLLEEQTKEAQHLNEMLESITSQHVASNNIRENLEQQVTAFETRMREKEDELSTAQQAAKNLRSENEELSHSHSHAESIRDNLQHTITQLETRLSEIQLDNAHLENQLNALQAKEQTWDLSNDISREQLMTTIEQDKITMTALMERVEKMVIAQQEANYREQEMDHSLRLLTVLAENQDRSLAAASAAMTKSQEYNKMLQDENEQLRQKISQLETKNVALRARETLMHNSDTADKEPSPLLPGMSKIWR